jgi:hypothetical protein
MWETCSAINTYAVPLLTYSFGIIDMGKKGIQRKTNKLITSARFHHPEVATERLTLPRPYGGRGLIPVIC